MRRSRQRWVNKMAYLIVWEFPNYPDTDTDARIVISKRHTASRMLEFSAVRAALEAKYSGFEISSPLGFLPKGLILGVYLSPNKAGEGRIGGNFQLWSVKQQGGK
jgi:hypothetical protein